MSGVIDHEWCARNPLPGAEGGDKEDRGRVLVVGGSAFVPGAPILTATAALRVGAGKVQIAVPDAVAIGIGIGFPESAIIGLPTDEAGDISPAAVDQLQRPVDAAVVGPGMSDGAEISEFVARLLETIDRNTPLVLDAGAMTALTGCRLPLERATTVLTPHHGELAKMTDVNKDVIEADPKRAAVDAAKRFNAIVVLKSDVTFIAKPDGTVLCFKSAAPGLGTAGSGDVLAGTIAGLLARGIEGHAAACWGVWLHGSAGVRAGEQHGKLGFLAREVLPFLSIEMEAAPHG